MSVEIMLSAFALMLIMEGVGPLLFPNKWQNFMLKLAKEKPNTIRQIGGVIFIFGFILLFFNN
ncbi:DUF2065 domain-containing protein [Thalassotalea sp. ND16A]|uniref:DUF2065 domain-containing protein n=1 Tax=Thalassotalea sp. ND16A TaxID=1535422 RepID=UPI000519FA40|nr:DUF2065 domain-containing protein [Thalassotalea sp. ND16A]KGK01062.1 hypothetical protein ND16A_3069 [Thalassotalea sp. ND16A]